MGNYYHYIVYLTGCSKSIILEKFTFKEQRMRLINCNRITEPHTKLMAVSWVHIEEQSQRWIPNGRILKFEEDQIYRTSRQSNGFPTMPISFWGRISWVQLVSTSNSVHLKTIGATHGSPDEVFWNATVQKKLRCRKSYGAGKLWTWPLRGSDWRSNLVTSWRSSQADSWRRLL